jgi:carbonic anhydrase
MFFLKNRVFIFCAGLLILGSLSADEMQPRPENKSLQRLMDGNKRFIKSASKSLEGYHVDRLATVERQKPFAIILACSDSRVAPEIIFDQGIGDLFVIRVAGNILSETQWESVKFAVEVLDVDTILVLGHEACGAVQAVLDKSALNVPIIVEQVAKGIGDQTDLAKATKANVRYVASNLKERLKNNNVTIAGGFYEILSGKVELLP